MGDISVRKLDNETLIRLRKLAALHGVSMEEEARSILRRGVAAPTEPIGNLALRYFGKTQGVDLELPKQPPHDKPIDFS